MFFLFCGIITGAMRWIKEHLELTIAIALIAIAAILSLPWPDKWFSHLSVARLGLVKLLAYLAGGVLLVWQIRISNRRATALEENVRQGDETLSLTREGNVIERFKNAVEHLGNPSLSVRMGGIYVLYNIAKAKESFGYARAVLEILSAHLRAQSGKPDCSDEVKAIVQMLFPNRDEGEVFKEEDSKYALQNVNLEGADLSGANLQSRWFFHMDFNGANLSEANLEDTIMYDVSFEQAYLTRARMARAELRKCFLGSAHCQHIDLSDADLDRNGSLLLTGADLSYADLRGVCVDPSLLMEASTLYKAKMSDSDLEAVRAEKPELLDPPPDS